MHKAVCASSFSGESDDACEKNETLRYIFQILNPFVEVTVDPPSWSELLRTSQNEGFSFLLYKGIIKKGVNVPSFLKEDLKQEYINNWGRNIRILEELAVLLRVFENPVIVLKGAALLF